MDMYKTDGIPLDLEHLLLEKDFEALSLQEKAWVLTDLTEREYRNMRQLLLGTRQFFAESTPNLVPRQGTAEWVKSRWQSRSTWGGVERLLTRSVPLWQAAAVTLLLCLTVSLTKVSSNWAGVAGMDGAALIADSTVHDSAIRQVNYKGDSLISATEVVNDKEHSASIQDLADVEAAFLRNVPRPMPSFTQLISSLRIQGNAPPQTKRKLLEMSEIGRLIA